MGGRLVKAAYAEWGGRVPLLPLHVLVVMSVTAKDDDAEPSFWGGHDSLAVALGREPTPTAIRSIREAVGVLKIAGAITPVGRPAPGRQARYRLHVGRSAPYVEQRKNKSQVAQPPVNNRPSGLPMQVPEPPRNVGGSGAATQVAQTPPEEPEGAKGRNQESSGYDSARPPGRNAHARASGR